MAGLRVFIRRTLFCDHFSEDWEKGSIRDPSLKRKIKSILVHGFIKGKNRVILLWQAYIFNRRENYKILKLVINKWLFKGMWMNLDFSLLEDWPQGQQNNSECRALPTDYSALASIQRDALAPIAGQTRLLAEQTNYWESKIHASLGRTFNWLVKQSAVSRNQPECWISGRPLFPLCYSLIVKTAADLHSLVVEHRWPSPARSPGHAANVRSCLCCGIRSWHETPI